MKVLSYVFETSLQFSEPVTRHSFVLRCLPRSTPTQTVMESQVFTNPSLQLNELVDGFGNRITSGWCPEAHDAFDFYASGVAMVSPEYLVPEPAHPIFLMPTPLTMPDAQIAAKAAEVRASMPDASPYQIARQLCADVYASFEYVPGSTDTHTTAAEAFAERRGVCQDYAHVLISLCRECGIPARYVTGLMVGEGATHAWVEAHDGEAWRGLDPTHDRPVDDNYLLISVGRDFEDCPIERGVFRGNAVQEQSVLATVGEGTGAMGTV